MSLISEQVEELRHGSSMFHKSAKLYKLLSSAADTIEELSAKLSSENMKRSEEYCNNDYVKVIRCKDCRRWGSTRVLGEVDSIKWCGHGNYFVHENGYCVYGEKK